MSFLSDLKGCLKVTLSILPHCCCDATMTAALGCSYGVVGLFGLLQGGKFELSALLHVPDPRWMHRLYPPYRLGHRERQSCRRVRRSDQ